MASGAWDRVKGADGHRRTLVVEAGRMTGRSPGPEGWYESSEHLVHHPRPVARRLPRGCGTSGGGDPQPGPPGRRGRPVHLPLRPVRPVRAQSGQPPDGHLPARPPVGPERHAVGRPVHERGTGGPCRRLRPAAVRPHGHDRGPSDGPRRRPTPGELRGPPARFPARPGHQGRPHRLVPVVGGAGARHLGPGPVPAPADRHGHTGGAGGQLASPTVRRRRDRDGLSGRRGDRRVGTP